MICVVGIDRLVLTARYKRKNEHASVYCQHRVMPELPECDGEGDNNKSDDDRDEPCL